MRLALSTEGDGRYRTTKVIRWYDEPTGVRLMVPVGFRTDLASIPRPLWSIIPPFGAHARAAVIHDFLYAKQGLRGKLTRAQCDRIFRDILTLCEVPMIRAWLMWLGVRLGGWLPWMVHGLNH